MGLSNTRLLVAWYTNWENKQSVVHSHPYHELVLPIGGSTVRYSVDGSVYLVRVGELVYFPSQVYHSGNSNLSTVDWAAKNITAAGTVTATKLVIGGITIDVYNGALRVNGNLVATGGVTSLATA